jgi:hypothetical protein
MNMDLRSRAIPRRLRGSPSRKPGVNQSVERRPFLERLSPLSNTIDERPTSISRRGSLRLSGYFT